MLPCCFHWKGPLNVKISHLTNGQLSFPVVYVNFICVCTWRRRGGKWWRRKSKWEWGSEEMSVSEGKRLIHTAGTVVASPASLALATVWSNAATVDTLLGAASCWWETNFRTNPALWRIVNWLACSKCAEEWRSDCIGQFPTFFFCLTAQWDELPSLVYP